MKKLLSIFTAFAMLLCLASCGGEATNDESPSTEQPLNTAKTQQEPASDTQEQQSDGSELVVYFSATGNTRSVGEALADMCGAELYEMVQEQILQAEVYVCEIQGKIRGFIGIADHFIAGIFVAADYRSHGTGKQLLDYVKQKHSSLSLQVYEKNDRAAAFYLREGFHVSSSGYDESTGETEYIMDWEP